MRCSRVLLAAMLASAMFMLAAFPALAGPRFGARRAMVRAIDTARRSHLRFSGKLSAAAAAWARHLFQSGALAHSARAVERHEGEVIEWHTGTAAHVRSVVREWLGSPDHRPVLLNHKWHRAGAGRAVGMMDGHRSTIWVVRFAR
jgi:uncharacterized protein YkwD